MREGTLLKDHLDVFHKIILDMKNIDVKLMKEDLDLIVFCSLPLSYEQFVTTMLSRRDTISMEDLKASLNFEELRKKVSANRIEPG